MYVRPQHGDLVGALEWRLAGETFVEHARQRVDVGAPVGRKALDVLGRYVLDGAEDIARPAGGRFGRGGPHQPEIGEVEMVLSFFQGPNQQVLGFDIAVNHTVFVRVVKRGGRLTDRAEGAVCFDRPTLFQHSSEIDALDQTHHDEELAIGLAEVEYGNDVSVIELRPHFGFQDEALPEPAIGRDLGEHQLERDDPAGLAVVRSVDDAHPSTT